jgi:hypothetical protein
MVGRETRACRSFLTDSFVFKVGKSFSVFGSAFGGFWPPEARS